MVGFPCFGAFFEVWADEDAREDVTDGDAFEVSAVSGDAHGFEDAVAHADVDEDPCDDFGAESSGDFVCFLGSADFAGDEAVEGGHVLGDGVVDGFVFDFGEGLEHDSVSESAFSGDHWVFGEECEDALCGVVGFAQVFFPLDECLFACSFDEGDEEVSFGFEVSVDDGFGDAGFFGDLCGGGAGVSPGGEEGGGDVEQLFTALCCWESSGHRVVPWCGGGVGRFRGWGRGRIRLCSRGCSV